MSELVALTPDNVDDRVADLPRVVRMALAFGEIGRAHV